MICDTSALCSHKMHLYHISWAELLQIEVAMSYCLQYAVNSNSNETIELFIKFVRKSNDLMERGLALSSVIFKGEFKSF